MQRVRAGEKQNRDKKKRRERKRYTCHASTNAYDAVLVLMQLELVYEGTVKILLPPISLFDSYL